MGARVMSHLSRFRCHLEDLFLQHLTFILDLRLSLHTWPHPALTSCIHIMAIIHVQIAHHTSPDTLSRHSPHPSHSILSCLIYYPLSLTRMHRRVSARVWFCCFAGTTRSGRLRSDDNWLLYVCTLPNLPSILSLLACAIMPHQHRQIKIVAPTSSDQNCRTNITAPTLPHQHCRTNITAPTLPHQHCRTNIAALTLPHQHCHTNIVTPCSRR